MLAVSPLRNAKDGNNQGEMETNFSVGDFTDFVSDTSLLESIDFDDLFLGIHVDEDVLPDLEMDPEILAEFSVTSGGEESGTGTFCSSISVDEKATENHQGHYSSKDRDEDKVSEMDNNSSSSRGEEIVSKRDESVVVNPIPKEAEKAGKKSSSSSAQSSKNTNSAQAQGKRKVKVDWTPDLHRRFVQAVEQLGVDKAVPSRILELMGIDCLTRHSIASHLQKYRSHRKHLLAREQEAANWSHQRRHMYGSAGKRGSATATDMLTSAATTGSWLAPATMGFPPHHHPHQHATMAHHQHHPHFRPLHVWGHPSLDHSLMHMWPKHLPHTPAATHPPPPLQPAWAAPPSHAPSRSTEASYWHPANHQQRISNAPTPGTLCFTQPPLLPTRFAAPPVPGIPPHAMYKVDARGLSVSLGPLASHHPFDFHPSKETIDAAIGDALSKPWLPLPLGLKPPSMDSVLGELQRQGVPKIPPTSTTSCA